MSATAIFLSGMATMGFILAGLFFFRFWSRTRDRLFVNFGFAFLLLALNQGIATLAGIPREELSWVYIFRIAAFGLLIAGIIAKTIDGKDAIARPPRAEK